MISVPVEDPHPAPPDMNIFTPEQLGAAIAAAIAAEKDGRNIQTAVADVLTPEAAAPASG
jgi:hypothetical protein